MSDSKFPKNDKRINSLANEIRKALTEGDKHQSSGLGTFSSCTRKASTGRPACTIAMYRPTSEIREYLLGGPIPKFSGAHKEIATDIVKTMKSTAAVEIPKLGIFTIKASEKAVQISFQGAEELNSAL